MISCSCNDEVQATVNNEIVGDIVDKLDVFIIVLSRFEHVWVTIFLSFELTIDPQLNSSDSREVSCSREGTAAGKAELTSAVSREMVLLISLAIPSRLLFCFNQIFD